MNAQIAQHLNVAEAAIIKIEEWANVIFAVVKGIGARFVSKKVAKAPEKTFEEKLVEAGGNRWKRAGHDRIYFNADLILGWLGYSWSHYNTGNISSATLNGESISNSKMKRAFCSLSKIWFDVTAKTWHRQGDSNEISLSQAVAAINANI